MVGDFMTGLKVDMKTGEMFREEKPCKSKVQLQEYPTRDKMNLCPTGYITFEWAEWPLGIPLEDMPDGSLGGKRTGPITGLAIIYCDGDEYLRNGVRVTCAKDDLTEEVKNQMYNLLTDWLRGEL